MRFLLLLLITFSSVLPQKTFAQETEKEETIATLNAKKEEVVQKEKEALKIEVLAINKRFENGELTEEEATILKKEAAKKHARNIEDKLAILKMQNIGVTPSIGNGL